jgi:hypothetical protein
LDERAGWRMGGIDSQEGKPSMCGAFMRRVQAAALVKAGCAARCDSRGVSRWCCWGDGWRADSGRRSRSFHAWQRPQVDTGARNEPGRPGAAVTPSVTPRRAAVTPSVAPRRAAVTPSVTPRRPPPHLAPLPARAPAPLVGISRRAGCRVRRAGGRAGRWTMDGNGSRQGNPAALGACVRRCSTAKRGDCRHSRGSVWIRRKSSEYGQCPNAPRPGTLGAMIHTAQNARQARRAPTPPTWRGRARTCPSLPTPGQPYPARPAPLPVLGRRRDTLSDAVEHDGCPRYAGRFDVDSTRSAAFSLRPPDALGSPRGLQLRCSSGSTAWRRASWRQARSVGHSAAGSLPPMQGQQETQRQQRRRATRSAASLHKGARP